MYFIKHVQADEEYKENLAELNKFASDLAKDCFEKEIINEAVVRHGPKDGEYRKKLTEKLDKQFGMIEEENRKNKVK